MRMRCMGTSLLPTLYGLRRTMQKPRLLLPLLSLLVSCYPVALIILESYNNIGYQDQVSHEGSSGSCIG